MNALDLLLALEERGMTCHMDDQGRLIVKPSRLLNDDDRANIRHHLPALKRLVSCDYTNHPEGWSVEPDMPNRVVLVRQGRLLDSCIFRTNEGALEYAALIAQGVGYAEAFSRAAAYEDALQALAACGWSGESVVNVARAIADGVTDEAMLTSMLCCCRERGGAPAS